MDGEASYEAVWRRLTSQSFSCRATSSLNFEEGTGLDLAKYFAVTLATSGEEAR
jgi:hypothetical protein